MSWPTAARKSTGTAIAAAKVIVTSLAVASTAYHGLESDPLPTLDGLLAVALAAVTVPPKRDDASSVVLGPMASRPDGQACQTRIQSTFIVWGS